MDRRGEILRAFVAGLLLAVAACASAPEADAPVTRDSLRALRWIAPGADQVEALTRDPVDCAPAPIGVGRPSVDEAKAELLMDGKMAFESPALLGGAAARMGLSCSSCHLNGRGNAVFFVEGVSGAPGTADVTSSLFSKVRGNGAFDPVPIPDLAARDGKQIKDRKSQAFRDKVHGLVVEEFDGQEPPPQVFEALLAYLDSEDSANCPAPGATTRRYYMNDLTSAISAAKVAERPGVSRDVALFYIRVARERLERLSERYAGAALASRREQLLALSQMLANNAELMRAGKPVKPLDSWIKLAGDLDADASRSLYNPETLRAALARS